MTAFFIFLIFFIWSVAILGSKFCCRRKAGFFSGQPPIKPLPPPGYQALDPPRRTPDDPSICQNQQDEITEDNDEIVPIEERTVSEPKDDQENLIVVNPETSAQSSVNHENRQSRHCPTQQEIEAYENGTKSGHRFLRRLRIIIFVAGLAVITSSIVFVVQGIYGIDDALKKGTDGLDKTLVIINSGASLCDSFLSAQQALSRNVSEAQQTFRNFSWCPALRDAFILECLNGTIGPNISETIALSNNSVCSTVAAISIPVQEALDAVETVLSRTLTTFLTEIENLRYDLLELSEIVTMWQGRVLSFSWAFWVSVLFILFLNLLVTYLLIGVVLAWRQRLTQPFTRARSKVVVPLFISVTFCVWLFASIFCIGAVLGADFCIDAPDSKVIEIISTNKDRFTSVVFELLVFYLSSCDATLKPTLTFTTDDGTNLVFEALLAGHDFVSRVQEIDEAQFMTTCGASFSPVASVADYVDAQFHIIFDSVFGTKKLFWCSNINPIYVTMAYDGESNCDPGT
jgi:hypothetical protein